MFRNLYETLVGIYKKPNSEILYAATKHSIYEITPSSIVEIKNVVSVDDEFFIPTEYKLSQNYPNPFNPTTIIKIVIPKLSFVNLKVYDILGREVATLVNEEKPAGNYKVEFDGSGLSSGIYFYKLQTENYSSVKKMILLK